jgi:hypothetical protein
MVFILKRPLSCALRFCLTAAAALTACGCGAGETSDSPGGGLIADPFAELPKSILDVGLYEGPPGGRSVAPAARGYTPAWELWSNGLAKDRYLVLPRGKTIDTSDRAAWQFPPGTLAFKTFFSGSADAAGRPIETRVMRRGESKWEYAVYLWNEDGADAALADIDTSIDRQVTVDGNEIVHTVPALLECRQCHESNTTDLIGIDELHLNTPLPGAGETQLEAMAAAGMFSGPLPADPEVIEGDDPLTLSVKGYMHGNCAYCHNAQIGPATAFDMRHSVFIENTINKPTEGSASAAGTRIVPGSPEQSILFLAFSGETEDPEVKNMPSVGVQLRDASAVEMLRSWIKGL